MGPHGRQNNDPSKSSKFVDLHISALV